MKVKDLVKFNRETFFEGAVQLNWVNTNIEQATKAGNSFIFHGADYHGINDNDIDNFNKDYALKDTISLLDDLTNSLYDNNHTKHNPFTLAIAGYGTGKSHLGVAITQLLREYYKTNSHPVLDKIKDVDIDISKSIETKLNNNNNNKPVLVVAIDGMGNFHLGQEISKLILQELNKHDLDLTPINELSPRFNTAEKFVNRNYEARKNEFNQLLDNKTKEDICELLLEHNEDVYSQVNIIFEKATGTIIPIDGQESVQELISVVVEEYCGEDGFFSNLLFIFDEFGRYLEYTADNPQLAGDAALQQLYQGVQDNKFKCHFFGLIQADLKAYFKRFRTQNLHQLERYIGRYDNANKVHLSTNLETIIANLIQKKENVSKFISDKKDWKGLHNRMQELIPDFSNNSVWRDYDLFKKIIVEGIWPLHPLTTWFLTKLDGVVQSRSAISFIEEEITKIENEGVDKKLPLIYPAEMCLGSMRAEIISSQQRAYSIVTENVEIILDKYQGRLNHEDKLLLMAIMLIHIMQIKQTSREELNIFIESLTGMSHLKIEKSIERLIDDYGTIEWNEDLAQYILIVDAASRGQFKRLIQNKLDTYNNLKFKEKFHLQIRELTGLEDVKPQFAEDNNISTQEEWRYKISFSLFENISQEIQKVFELFEKAITPFDNKGFIIYCYIPSDSSLNDVDSKIKTLINHNLKQKSINDAPIIVIPIIDINNEIIDNFKEWDIIENVFTNEEKGIYKRFIDEYKERYETKVSSSFTNSIKNINRYIYAVSRNIKGKRLKQICNSMFEIIYNKIIPFDFDGFNSTRSNGLKDCNYIIEQLIRGQLRDGLLKNWLTSQTKSVKNRFEQVLIKSWKSLPPNKNKLLETPKNKIIADIFKDFDLHLENSGNFKAADLYNSLLKAPYGMNTASASLLFAIYISRDIPQTSYSYKNNSIGGVELLELLYDKKKKNIFKYLILNDIEIIYIRADLETQWKNALNKCYDEKKHSQKITIFEIEIASLKKNNPIPETQLDLFKMVKDKYENAVFAINKFEKETDKISDDLEWGMKNNNVRKLSLAGINILKLKEKIIKDFIYWDNKDVALLEKMLNDMVISEINKCFEEWLKSQTCVNITLLGECKKKLIYHTFDNLKKLGLGKEAELVEKRFFEISKNVEFKQLHNDFIIKCKSFAEIIINKTLTVNTELKANINQGNEFTEFLDKKIIPQSKTDKDLPILSDNIKKKVREMGNLLSSRKKDLEHFFNVNINSEFDVLNAKEFVVQKQKLFIGTKDESDFKDMRLQLDLFENFINQTKAVSGNGNYVEIELGKITKNLLEQTDKIQESGDVEFILDSQEVSESLSNNIIDNLNKKSSEWIDIKKDFCDKEKLSLGDIDEFVNNQNIPNYLSNKDKEILESLIEKLELQKDEIQKSNNQKWLINCEEKLDNLSSFSEAQCKDFLSSLHKHPDNFSDEDYKKLNNIKMIIESKIDEININILYNRIIKLSDNMKDKLFALLDISK